MPGSREKGGTRDAVIEVRVIPRASRAQIDEAADGRLRVKVTASPVDGAANEQLILLLAERFGVSRGDIVILRGHSGRLKTVRIRM